MTIIYRISDSGYSKQKLEYINNENCLKNARAKFPKSDFIIIADNVSNPTYQMIMKYFKEDSIKRVSVGNGAGTFNIALDFALMLEREEVIYFLENDYLHRTGSEEVIVEGLVDIKSDFLTLYDHLDKYQNGVNPYVQDGGEETRVLLSTSCHWKLTNSTTMTFAATVETLRKYEHILRKHTSTTHPYDFPMWIELRELGASLISPIPSYSTHGDLPTVAPLINWKDTLC